MELASTVARTSLGTGRVARQDDPVLGNAFSDPVKYNDLVQSYGPRMMGATFLGGALLTAFGGIAVDWDVTDGWGGSAAVVWLLLVAQIPPVLVARSRLNQRRERSFAAWYWFHSLLQFLWLQHLCWLAAPVSWVVGTAILLAWAFNDAWNFWDARHVLLQYATALLVFDVSLLAVDALGGRGLLHLVATEPGVARAFLASQLFVTLLACTIVVLVGRHARDHDQRHAEHGRLEGELALLRREREIVQQSCSFLTNGLTASRFSHDVANPICVISGNVSFLNEMLQDGPLDDPSVRGVLAGLPEAERLVLAGAVGRWRDTMRELGQEIGEATDKVSRMTSVLARSVRSRLPLTARSPSVLVEGAVKAGIDAVLTHDVTPMAPRLELEPCEVWVTDEHVASLGTLISNGMLQRPDAPMDVTGRAASPWFYVISVRDRGVAPAARPEALAAVRRSLALAPDDGTTPARKGGYRGFGIGLMLAKVLFLRYNGWLEVAEPDDGPGLVFHVVLPRVDPATIPERANAPELAAASPGETR